MSVQRQYPDDDGRTIAPMDIDGMPNSMLDRLGWFRHPTRRPHAVPPPDDPDAVRKSPAAAPVELTPAETRGVIANALLATLLIAGIFLAAAALFILFCTKVWFA